LTTSICVLGLGYIGLPTASMFASQGFKVHGVDVREDVVRMLSSGNVHIQEPGLSMLVQSAIQSGNLTVSTAVERADVFIIAVPTPFRRAGAEGSLSAESAAAPVPDLSYVTGAAESIRPTLEPGNLVVLESTSPPGTTAGVVRPVLEQTGLVAGSDFSLAYCAERVLPGRILMELVTNDRVVGGIDRESAERAQSLYAAFVEGEIFKTDVTTAEMVKLMENTFRDVNIALANEFSRVARAVGIDVFEAIQLANHHPRVNVLQPGPGVGGHCIAVDPWFIVSTAPAVTPLIANARAVNDGQPAFVVSLIEEAVADLPDSIIALLGVAYKADVGDFRESPSLQVYKLLLDRGYEVRMHDPYADGASNSGHGLLGLIRSDLESAMSGVDLAVLLTDHTAYRELQPSELVSCGMVHRRIVDTRNCLDPDRWKAEGFAVHRLAVDAPSYTEIQLDSSLPWLESRA